MEFFCFRLTKLVEGAIRIISTVAYRNVESLGLFGYDHKVFSLKGTPPLVLTIFLPSISGYNKFIPQVRWLNTPTNAKRQNIAVK